MWDRPDLDRRDRSLFIVTTLATQARDDELVAHTQIGIRHGLTPDEIVEILTSKDNISGINCEIDSLLWGEEYAPRQALPEPQLLPEG